VKVHKKARLHAHTILVLFAEKVTHEMVSQGMTRTGLAVKSMVPSPIIDDLIAGMLEDLDLKSMVRIAEVLGLDLNVSFLTE